MRLEVLVQMRVLRLVELALAW